MDFASPGQIALTAAAIGWPLAAGFAVVIWSKRRAAQAARQEAELSGRLKGLYRSVELREPPERLAATLEALEEQAQVEAAAAAARATLGRAGRSKAARD